MRIIKSTLACFVLILSVLFNYANADINLPKHQFSPEFQQNLINRSEENDIFAIEIIGDSFLWGNAGTEFSFEKAFYWYQKGARIQKEYPNYESGEEEATHTRIMVKLSEMYARGLGTEVNEEASLKWLHQASTIYGNDFPGHPLAHVKLGLLFFPESPYFDSDATSPALEQFNLAKMRGREFPVFAKVIVERDSSPTSLAVKHLPCSRLLEGRPSLSQFPYHNQTPIPQFVKFKINVASINNVDTTEQQVGLTLYREEAFRDYRLSFVGANFRTVWCQFDTKKIEKSLSSSKPLFLWSPDISIANTVSTHDISSATTEIATNGVVNNFSKIHASVFAPMDLRKFPFDIQTIRLRFSPADLPVSEVRLTAHTTALDADQAAPIISNDGEWQVVAENSFIEDFFELGNRKSSYVHEIKIKRNPIFYILNLFLPLLLLFLVSISHFWFPSDKLDAKVTVALSSLIAVIAYQFITNDDLPRLSYMTSLDVTILGTIALIAMNIITIAINQNLRGIGQQNTAEQVNKYARLLFPLGWLVFVTSINLPNLLNWFFA